jgi:hypothetical protein
VEIEHPRGWVAYHLPGANPFLNEYSDTYGIPQEAVRGGAETMYPEYLEKLKKMPVPAKPVKAAGNK